jgi:hypothetical protein
MEVGLFGSVKMVQGTNLAVTHTCFEDGSQLLFRFKVGAADSPSSRLLEQVWACATIRRELQDVTCQLVDVL